MKAGRGRPPTRPVLARPRRARGPAPTRLPSLGRHRTLEELAYADIRRAIVDGTLAPGQRIVPSAVAASSGVSRIPVLQALRRLESEGFVRIAPHREVAVTTLSPQDFRERFLLMAALEGLCLREAAPRLGPALLGRLRAAHERIVAARAAGNAARAVAADGDFHRLLWDASGLPQVVQLLQNLWDRGEYYRAMMHARRGGFAAESLDEHGEILAALGRADLAAAAGALEAHRLRAMERLAATPAGRPGGSAGRFAQSPPPARRTP